MAGISTGASCGCAPTVNDNFHINVFPLTSLGLHVTYQPIEPLTIQASLYNGIAYDTFHRSFRFRPHRDGVITLGSISYERPADNDEDFGATYLIGWNFGNHYRESTQRRHSQSGFWLTAEQPICHLGRVGVAVGATFAHEFKDPEVATGYWNGTLALNRLTRIGGTFALVLIVLITMKHMRATSKLPSVCHWANISHCSLPFTTTPPMDRANGLLKCE